MERLLEMERTLGKILATQELILSMLDENKRDHERIAKRVGVIEGRMNFAAGAVMIVTAGLSILISFVMSGFKV